MLIAMFKIVIFRKQYTKTIPLIHNELLKYIRINDARMFYK